MPMAMDFQHRAKRMQQLKLNKSKQFNTLLKFPHDNSLKLHDASFKPNQLKIHFLSKHATTSKLKSDWRHVSNTAETVSKIIIRWKINAKR